MGGGGGLLLPLIIGQRLTKDLLIGEAQPEDFVAVHLERLDTGEQDHVADVHLDMPHLLPVEQHGVVNVLTRHLQGKKRNLKHIMISS